MFRNKIKLNVLFKTITNSVVKKGLTNEIKLQNCFY